MRVVLTVMALAASSLAHAGDDPLRSHARALQTARERLLPMLLDFREGDCGHESLPGEKDALGRAVHTAPLNDCGRMEDEVWSRADVKAELERFVRVRPEESVHDLRRRYQVRVFPTLLITDPWGNEIVRAVHFTPHAKMLPILKAIPADFAPLAAHGEALARDGEDVAALVGAARFYEGVRLGVVSDRYYERALATAALKGDVSRRHDLAIARAANLLKLDRPGEAAKVFETALEEAPSSPRAELLLLGQVMAAVQGGQRKPAERAYEKLRERFPGSAATARAAEHLKALTGASSKP
jgi:hypothetical protein